MYFCSLLTVQSNLLLFYQFILPFIVWCEWGPYGCVLIFWVSFNHQERELLSHFQVLVSEFSCQYLLKNPSMCISQKLTNDLWIIGVTILNLGKTALISLTFSSLFHFLNMLHVQSWKLLQKTPVLRGERPVVSPAAAQNPTLRRVPPGAMETSSPLTGQACQVQ